LLTPSNAIATWLVSAMAAESRTGWHYLAA
jgi:hypothetical protein